MFSFYQGWMQNEPIFSSDDIMEQLPNEGKKFRTINRQWRKAMDSVKAMPNVVQFSESQPRLLETFKECNRTIDEIQKGVFFLLSFLLCCSYIAFPGLNEYLEKKRQAFGRFYFLSDGELLEILSQTREPRAVQKYLRKCFEAINRLEFETDNKMISMYRSGFLPASFSCCLIHSLIHSICSGENENVPFTRGIYPEGNVETWLGHVESMMKDSVKAQIRESLLDYRITPRNVLPLSYHTRPSLFVDCLRVCDTAMGAQVARTSRLGWLSDVLDSGGGRDAHVWQTPFRLSQDL